MFHWALTRPISESEALTILCHQTHRPTAVIILGDHVRLKEIVIAKIACRIDCQVRPVVGEDQLAQPWFARQQFVIVEPFASIAQSRTAFTRLVQSLRAAGAQTIATISVEVGPESLVDSTSESAASPAASGLPVDPPLLDDLSDLDYRFRVHP